MTAEVGAQVVEVPLGRERVEQPAEVAGRRGEVRRRDVDGVEADDRVERRTAGRRGPCARPGDGPGSRAARRRRRRRGHAPCTTGDGRRPGRLLGAVGGLDLAGAARGATASDVMPCLGNAPNAGVTAQRPQMPRPPQTESMSTPSDARRVEHGRPAGDAAAPARRGEDDLRLRGARVMGAARGVGRASAGDGRSAERRRPPRSTRRPPVPRRSGGATRNWRIQRAASWSLPISTSLGHDRVRGRPRRPGW